jgi:hypothetical protein
MPGLRRFAPTGARGHARMTLVYGLDLLIVLLAFGAVVAAVPERHPAPFPRWRLLLPGLLAISGTIILLSYPDIRDLADPQMGLIGLLGMLVGALRGWAMRIESDQAHRLVRVHRGGDASWAAWAMVLFAAIQGAIETQLSAENPYEPSAELLMVICSGYLFGRSLTAWLRARTLTHHDLIEE